MTGAARSNHASTGASPAVGSVERERPERGRPTMNRAGVTHKVTLGEMPDERTDRTASSACRQVDFYITLNRYPDGRPCEIFAKATNGYQGWCDAVCRLVSLLLQHGVQPETICRQLAFAHFAPCGRVPGLELGGRSWFARSFVDYLARWMEGDIRGDSRAKTQRRKGEKEEEKGA
jgi:hypothetical protein